jgi:hypothetical protein
MTGKPRSLFRKVEYLEGVLRPQCDPRNSRSVSDSIDKVGILANLRGLTEDAL